MKIELLTHTIIPMIAPSCAGKSYLCENVLIPQLKEKYPDLNVQYISSDAIRRQLLGSAEAHKHDVEMGQVSGQAFQLLKLQLEMATSFSVSAEIIIVDTTGLAEQFREEILAHGKATHYNVAPIIFDFDVRNDYFKYKDDESLGHVVAKHVNKLKKEVLKTVNKKKYQDVFRVKSNDFSEIEVTVKDYDFYRSHFLPELKDDEYCVVGDLHGCLDQFKALIVENNCAVVGGTIMGNKKFIVQDYLDKGYDIGELIKFIYHNWKGGTILPLIGNHENYVYKRIIGELKADEDLDNGYFNSVPLLLENEELRTMFIELFEASKHFYRHKLFFINHAPCKEKYLGKIDATSLKNQRNFRYPKRVDAATDEEYLVTLEESLSFIKDYTNWSAKPVIWGHVAIQNTSRFANIYMIDTGCVSGNKLASIAFGNDGRSYIKVAKAHDDERLTKKSLPALFAGKMKKDVVLDDLEPEDYRRIRYLCRNKINYIAGTMCPADKDLENGVLESLLKGLEYYKNGGVSRVILQKKYMGSNAVSYLYKDIEKCYTTSRNGYIVDKRVDLKSEYARLLNKYDAFFEIFEVEVMVINSELMPWSALGKGLIADSFMPVQIGTTTEFELLNANGFYGELEKVMANPLLDEYLVDAKQMSKKALAEKYDYRVHQTLKNIGYSRPQNISAEDYKNGMETYKRQLDLFGGDGDVKLLPFNILKIVKTDGSEVVYMDETSSNISNFSLVSDDVYEIVDFREDGWYEKGNKFFNKVTLNEELEGIVIKPEFIFNKGLAPALKVRNERYLTLTYGFDYKKPNKFTKLIHKKHIARKLKASINEFEIGRTMMEIPLAEVGDGNQAFYNAAAQMILDEKIVERLDPRL